MIDFIFAVGHTQHWHSLNINQNRKHYSYLGTLGSGAVTMLQENLGAGVYYNPYVKIDDMVCIKHFSFSNSFSKILTHFLFF